MTKINEAILRRIVREEISRVLSEVKKGDKVRTPHGEGVVLRLAGEQVKVKLNSGAAVNTHRDRAKPIN